MESDVVVLLRLWREGALFMKSNGKSRVILNYERRIR